MIRWLYMPSRRSFLTVLAASGIATSQQRGRNFPSDKKTYLDAATEFPVVRLTDPSYSSFLPVSCGRSVFRRRNSMLFWSDRGGSPQAVRMDLKSGEWEQLTEARDLRGSTLALLPDERSICYFDGDSLRQTSLSSFRGREVYRLPEGWKIASSLGVAGDGVHAAFVEARDDIYRLRLVGIARGDAATVVEAKERLGDPIPRPGRAGLLYRRGEGSLWLVNYDGAQDRPLRIAAGRSGPAAWSADGRTVLYLNYPEDRKQLNSIREHTPDANADSLVAPTSQFVQFSPNSDDSVFVGVSGSKASPYVLILLRVTRRELTLCEHRASDPSLAAPVFSADSQWIFFQSDRHGRPAIYSMQIEKLVEKTEA